MNLADNCIKEVENVHDLTRLPNLVYLTLTNNPIGEVLDYRRRMFMLLGSDIILDGIPCTDSERQSLLLARRFNDTVSMQYRLEWNELSMHTANIVRIDHTQCKVCV